MKNYIEAKKNSIIRSMYAYVQLMRLENPVGILLLLWPVFWALWLATSGAPSFKMLTIFTLGVIITRSAGCVINDIADRNFDLHVTRTKKRPITSGQILVRDALLVFLVLMLLAFLLVLLLNPLTIKLSFVALFLCILYPFLKRLTHLPQLGLGVAFSFSIPMVWAAETGSVSYVGWLLFLANIFWVLAYDTQYAMIDRDDDLKIGIKSTAILLGNWDKVALVILQILFLLTLFVLGLLLSMSPIYYASLALCCIIFYRQFQLVQTRKIEGYFNAFLSNQWVGFVIALGIAVHYLLLP